jgi:inosose dehydratase
MTVAGGSLRLAGAPISWGVSEVPGWGVRLAPERVLAEMGAAGLRATELGPPGFLPAAAAQLREALERAGLELAGGFVAVPLHLPDRRAGALAEVIAAADQVAGAGGEVLVLAAATGRDGYDARPRAGADAWRELAGGLAAAGRIASDRGLRLAVHPHWGSVIQDPGDVERLLAVTAADLCLDTGHLAVGGTDPLEFAQAAGDRTVHVHLKDVDARLAGRVRSGSLPFSEAVRRGLFRPLGDGDVDLAGLLSRLLERGYGGWFVVEQDVALATEPSVGEGPLGDVRRSVSFFDRVTATDASRFHSRGRER